MTWEEERKKRYRFKNIYQSSVMNIDRIHPLQQKNVISIVKELQKSDIEKVVVIGSSLNMRCNPWSDLDLVFYGALDGPHRAYVEMKVLSVVEGVVDMLWMQDIKDTNRILEDIEGGVAVYEQTSFKCKHNQYMGDANKVL